MISTMSNRIICLGEILFDCLANELGQSIDKVSSWTMYPGGAPANTACALVKLGTPTAFVGCIGRDSLGKDLLQLLKKTGVNTEGVQFTADFPTRQVYVLRSSTGDRSFAGFGERPTAPIGAKSLRDAGALAPSDERRKRPSQALEVSSKDADSGTRELGKQSPDAFADTCLKSEHLLEKLFIDAEYLVIGTLELAYPQSRQAIFQALELAKKHSLKVVLDVNHREKFWLDSTEAKPLIHKLWQYIDFLKLAQEEALWLFDTDDAGTIYHSLNSLEGVVVTNGENEVSYCISQQEGKVKPFSVVVRDTTGAGDAFLAGLIHQLCQIPKQSLCNPKIVQQIITYACAVGGLSATKEGAISAQPTADEVTAFLQKSL